MSRWIIPLLLTLGLFADWMLLSYLYNTIGFAATLLIVVLFIPWGLYLQFSQSAAIRDQLFEAFRTGQRIPETALEGVMVMLGGVMMIVPGVLSSLLGLAMVLPASRTMLAPLVMQRLVMMLPPEVSAGDVSGSVGGSSGARDRGASFTNFSGGRGSARGDSDSRGARGTVPRGSAGSRGPHDTSYGFGRDVVDANPGRSRARKTGADYGPRGRASTREPGPRKPGQRGYSTTVPGFGQVDPSQYGQPGSGQAGSGQAGSGGGRGSNGRKSIEAEIVNIERNDKPGA